MNAVSRPSGTGEAARPAGADVMRWTPALLWVMAGALGLAALSAARPWRTGMIGLCSLVWAMGSLWQWWRSARRDASPRLVGWYSMAFTLFTVLASASIGPGLALLAPWAPLPERAVGAMAGVALAMTAALVVVSLPRGGRNVAAAECLAWPSLALLAVVLPMARWTDDYNHRELEAWPSMVGAVDAAQWGLAAMALICAAVAWRLRGRSDASAAGAGLAWVTAISVGSFMVGSLSQRSAPASTYVGVLLLAAPMATAGLLWLRFGQQSRPARTAAQLVISAGAALLIAFADIPSERFDAAWLVLLAFVGLPLLQLWRDWRRPPEPYPEGGNACLHVALTLGISVAVSIAFESLVRRWIAAEQLPFSIGNLSGLAIGASWLSMTAAFVLLRRRTLSWPALLVQCASWLFGGLAVETVLPHLLDPLPVSQAKALHWIFRAAWFGLPVLALLAKGAQRWRHAGPPAGRPLRPLLGRAARAAAPRLLEVLMLGLLAAMVSPLPSAPWIATRVTDAVAPEQQAMRATELALRMNYFWNTDDRSLQPEDRSPEAVLERLRDRDDRFSRVMPDVDDFSELRLLRRGYFDRSLPPPGDDELTMLIAGRRVGYWNLGGWAPWTLQALQVRFYRDDVSAVILDLRDPELRTAKQALGVAEVLLDASVRGKTFVELDRASRHAPRVERLRFFASKDPSSLVREDLESQALGVKEVVALTSERTCGAAELLLHGLRPHVRVRTVGGPTCGAPYDLAREPLPEGQSLHYVVARHHGSMAPLAPDCPAAAARGARPGSADDPLMQAAIHLLAQGRCPDVP